MEVSQPQHPSRRISSALSQKGHREINRLRAEAASLISDFLRGPGASGQLRKLSHSLRILNPNGTIRHLCRLVGSGATIPRTSKEHRGDKAELMNPKGEMRAEPAQIVSEGKGEAEQSVNSPEVIRVLSVCPHSPPNLFGG
jgi:hypothetical protein